MLVQVAQQEGPPGLETEPMLFPPPLFTKQDLPMDYAFRSYYGADPDYMKTGGPPPCYSIPALDYPAVYIPLKSQNEGTCLSLNAQGQEAGRLKLHHTVVDGGLWFDAQASAALGGASEGWQPTS